MQVAPSIGYLHSPSETRLMMDHCLPCSSGRKRKNFLFALIFQKQVDEICRIWAEKESSLSSLSPRFLADDSEGVGVGSVLTATTDWVE